MSLNETALACLNRNRLLYLNMLEVGIQMLLP